MIANVLSNLRPSLNDLAATVAIGCRIESICVDFVDSKGYQHGYAFLLWCAFHNRRVCYHRFRRLGASDE